MKWFRLYTELVDDPKVQRINPHLFKFWVNCLCLCARNDGILPPIPEVAWKFRMRESQVSSMVAQLHEAGLMDAEMDSFTPHNWAIRQYKSDRSTERVRKFRERSRPSGETDVKRPGNVTSIVSETPPETETETDTEQRQKQSTASPRDSPSVAVAEFPKTTAAIREHYASTSSVMCSRIITASVQAWAGVDNPLIECTDEILSEAIRKAKSESPKQNGAALFVNTVPEVIRTWASHGRSSPPSEQPYKSPYRTAAEYDRMVEAQRGQA